MRSARKNGIKKRRGRPATGQGVQIGTRWPEQTIAAIDAWAMAQEDQPPRSQAIRWLVEIGLKASVSTGQSYQIKASESASKARKLSGELGLKVKK